MNISLLKKLGLNGYESKIYLSLVEYNSLTAKEVAKMSGVPPTAVYPSLRSLNDKKLISLSNKDPLTYEMIDPKLGLKTFKELVKNELDNAEEEALLELTKIKNTGAIEKEEDFLNILKGWHQSAEMVKKLLHESQKEFLLLSGMTKKTSFIIVHALKDAIERGVKVRFILNRRLTENKQIVKQFSSFGVEIRYYPMRNFAIEVKDAKESVLVLRNPKLKDRIVVHMINKNLAIAHRDYFYSVWKKALPL